MNKKILRDYLKNYPIVKEEFPLKKARVFEKSN